MTQNNILWFQLSRARAHYPTVKYQRIVRPLPAPHASILVLPDTRRKSEFTTLHVSHQLGGLLILIPYVLVSNWAQLFKASLA